MLGKHLTAELQPQPSSVSLKDSLELVLSVYSWMQPDLVECLLLYIYISSWGLGFMGWKFCFSLRVLEASADC